MNDPDTVNTSKNDTLEAP